MAVWQPELARQHLPELAQGRGAPRLQHMD